VQPVVRNFGKTAFPKIPTAGCTHGPTAICPLVLVERNLNIFVAAAGLLEFFVTFCGNPLAENCTHMSR
jgi:hypothetical protein